MEKIKSSNKIDELKDISYKLNKEMLIKNFAFLILGILSFGIIAGIGIAFFIETHNWWLLSLVIIGFCVAYKLFDCSEAVREKVVKKYLNYSKDKEALLMINPYFEEEKESRIEVLSTDCETIAEEVVAHYLLFKPFVDDNLLLRFKVDEDTVKQYKDIFKKAAWFDDNARYVLCKNLDLIKGEYEVTSFRQIYSYR